MIKQNPARRWLDTLNNVEMVSVNNPDTGQWLVVVDGRMVRANQSKGGGPSDFRQDYSLATDFHLTRDTQGPDDMGPLFGYNGSTCDRQTCNGNLQLKGYATTGALSGLIFGNAASMKTNGDLACASLLTNKAAWLDVAGNLTGGLILRAPDGKVTMHIATNGTVRVRANAYQGLGAF